MTKLSKTTPLRVRLQVWALVLLVKATLEHRASFHLFRSWSESTQRRRLGVWARRRATELLRGTADARPTRNRQLRRTTIAKRRKRTRNGRGLRV